MSPGAVFACALLVASKATASSTVATLYSDGVAGTNPEAVETAFKEVYDHFAGAFDTSLYERFASNISGSLALYRQSPAYNAYALFPTAPHCDRGVASPVSTPQVGGVSAYPGGVVGRVFGFDFGKELLDLSENANGPAAAGLIAPMALARQALSTGMGLIQSSISSMLHVVPPLVSPPLWNNQPMTCVPMVSGHNCFGAVTYPITMADFVLADVTDSMLDGYVAGFPQTYARKVGKTSDEMYSACFSSYMSMMCSSLFPRCTTPQSREETMPTGGRVPMCLHMCILPLVMCPGFWMDDLIGSCSAVSVPPLCTQASFTNVWRLPPQYKNYDEAHPFSPSCPKSASVDGGTALGGDFDLYESKRRPASPIEKAARGQLELGRAS